MTDEPKIDLFKELRRSDYLQAKTPTLVTLGQGTYLATDGRGEPGSEIFQTRIGALYGVAYTIKMTRKFEGLRDYVIGKLEALWWCDGSDFDTVAKSEWSWTMMIRTPEFIADEDLHRAVSVLQKRGKGAAVAEVRLMTLGEGHCVQMLHIGPYENEEETLESMASFADELGYQPQGKHHEIYVSDPRRIPAERLKTILRMPVVSSH